MSFISAAPVNSAGPPASALPVAVMQAMGAAGSSPTAKLLLPQAVTASVLVPAYASETPRAPGKVFARITTSQPLSTLAAQLLAQTTGSSPEQVALFTPRPQTNLQTPVQQQPNANQTQLTQNTLPTRPGESASAQQGANNVPSATPSATTILPFMISSANVPRKPANENLGSQNNQSQGRERVSTNSLRGMSAYQAANKTTGGKSEYAIEAVG